MSPVSYWCTPPIPQTRSLQEDVFRTVVADCAAESRVGGLNTATVQFPPPIGLSEVEVTETVADANGALLVTLTAHQPGITRVAPTVPEFNLERTPRLTVPPFTHAAQPAESHQMLRWTENFD